MAFLFPSKFEDGGENRGRSLQASGSQQSGGHIDMKMLHTQSYGNSELTIGNCDRIALSYKHCTGRFVIERSRLTVYAHYSLKVPQVCELYNFLKDKGFNRIRSQAKKIQTSGSDAGISIIVNIKSAGFRHEVRNSEKNTLSNKDRPTFDAIDRAITTFNTRNILDQNILVQVIVDRSAVAHFLERGHSMSLFIPETVGTVPNPETNTERRVKFSKRLLFTLQPARAIRSARSVGGAGDHTRARLDTMVFEPQGEVTIKRAFLPLGTYHLQLVSHFEDDLSDEDTDEHDSHLDGEDDEFEKAHAAEFCFTTASEFTVQHSDVATISSGTSTLANVIMEPLDKVESLLRVSIDDRTKRLLVKIEKL